MTLLKIALMGRPVLRRKAAPIDDPTDPAVAVLARDMIETMDDAGGVGLAGPQIHADRRIIVFRAPAERLAAGEEEPPEGVTVLVNPVVEPLDDMMALGLEGCLSIPGLRGLVPRHDRIRYSGTGLDGGRIEREATGFHARVVQHEVDHLDGILYLDRMDGMETLAFDSELHHLLEQEESTDDD